MPTPKPKRRKAVMRPTTIKAWAIVNPMGDIFFDSGTGYHRLWIYLDKPNVYRSDETVVRVEIRELG